MSVPVKAAVLELSGVLRDGLRASTDRRQAIDAAIVTTVSNSMLELGRPG